MRYVVVCALIAACGSSSGTSKVATAAPEPFAPPGRTQLLGSLEGDWQRDSARLWSVRNEGTLVVVHLDEPPRLLVIQEGLFFMRDPGPSTHTPMMASLMADHAYQCDEQGRAAGEVRFECVSQPDSPAAPPSSDSSTPDEILAATTPRDAIKILLGYRRDGDALIDLHSAHAPRTWRRGTGTSAPDVEALDRTTPLYENAPGTTAPAASRRDDTGTFAAVVGTWDPEPGARFAPGPYARLWRRTAAGWTVVAQFPERRAR